MNDELMRKAKALVDSVSEDVNGKPGMPFSGNGGLVSDRTIRACDDLRLAMAKAVVNQGWAKQFLDGMANWLDALKVEDPAGQTAAKSNATNCRRIKELL